MRRHDTQHNYIQHIDSQHNDTQLKGHTSEYILYSDIQLIQVL
jgi:hypothetical protein